MKKFVLAAIIFIAGTAGAFAQRNTVYAGGGGGISIPFSIESELFASYEFEIVPQFSVGISAAVQFYPFALAAVAFAPDTIKDASGTIVEGQAHWYPWGEAFHLDAGLGYSDYLSSMPTFLIAPGIGWRFDLGEPGGLVLMFSTRAEIFMPLGDNFFKYSDQDAELTPVNIFASRIGLGFRF